MNLYKTKRWQRKRERILKRDEYLCQECKRYGKTKQAEMVHHIYPLEERPDLGLMSWNLISLCYKCHEAMHNRETGLLTEIGKQWVERVKRKI